MLPIIEQTFEIIKTVPGLGAAELARRLRIAPCNARRAAKALVDAGRVVLTGDQSSGYRYWIRNTMTQSPAAPPQGDRPQQVIDGVFREIAAPQSSSGRDLVPVGQPYDNRIAAVLARNAQPRRAEPRPIDHAHYHTELGSTLGASRSGLAIGAALQNAFVIDPSGDEVLADLALSWREQAAAARAVKARVAQQHVAEARRRRADAQAAQGARTAERERVERAEMLRAVTGLWSRQDPVLGSSTPVLVPENGKSVPVSGTEGPGYGNGQAVRISENVYGAAERTARVPKAHVTEFFAGARPAARTDFWRRHFATPSKSIWK